MLVLEDIKEKMKKHFPRWMDIRRKINSSIGGLYLSSIAEEISEIQEAIDEYKKDFFIDKYLDNPDSIMSFLYKVSIGEEFKNLSLVEPEYEITTDQNKFYNEDNLCYYEDGNLYFKSDIPVIYKINDYKIEASTEKIHVWNIYDEFAIFLGLRRYQWETNSELLARILSFNKQKANSTEVGLRHLLVSNLGMEDSEIKIEVPTPENLIKYYDKYETILDHLSGINKDVYREKIWDLSVWNFPIKSIDYIPHAWDIYIEDYVNGIGDNDDLKVNKYEEDSKTNVKLNFYKKDIDKLDDYTKQHNIEKEFKITLKKYNSKLEKLNVKYQLTASETKRINTNDISLKAIENKVGTFNINLEDIIKNYNINDIYINDNSIFEKGYTYTLDFIPVNSFGNFQIDYCKQINDSGNQINLLDANKYLTFESIGEGIRSTVCKKYITDSYQLLSSDNIKNIVDGFRIDNLSKEANMYIDIDGLQNKFCYFDYLVNDTAYDYRKTLLNNVYFLDGYLISDTVEEEKYIEISESLNSFSCDIYGPYKIMYKINGVDYELTDDFNKEFHFSIDKSMEPVDFYAKIVLLDDNVKVQNLLYSKFNITFSTDNGNLLRKTDHFILPNSTINKLKINMIAYAGVPVIKYIYIGNPLSENNGYYNISFDPEKGQKLLTKFSNCRLRVKKYKDEELISVEEDYFPYSEYVASSRTKIEIDLTNYIIDSIDSNVEVEDYGTYKKYFLNLNTAQTIKQITLSGKSYFTIIDISLSQILLNKGIKFYDYNWYIAKNEEGLIGINIDDNSTIFTKIYSNEIFNDSYLNNITISKPDDIACKFVSINNGKIYDSSYYGNFDYIGFEPLGTKIYYAVNEVSTIMPELNDIDIVNTFNGGYDLNSKVPYFYTVKSLDNIFDVRFDDNSIFELSSTKSFDSKKLKIKAYNLDNFNFNYTAEMKTLTLPASLYVSIPDYSEYVLECKYAIKYEDKDTDPDNYLSYIVTENIHIDDSKITKLKYSNISEIESISSLVNYKLFKKEGIIIWDEGNIDITIIYNIKKPKYIVMNDNELYSLIKYPVNTLTLLDSLEFKNLKDGDKITLTNYEKYKNADITTVTPSNAEFLVNIINDILRVSKEEIKDFLYVNTGYYYFNGREYYFFSSEFNENNDPDNILDPHNVLKENNEFIFRQAASNYLSNSKLILDIEGEIYNVDYSDKEFKIVSSLNEISSCDSFNYWNSYNCDLSITKGLNGSAISVNGNGYCYLNLSKYLSDNDKYYLSFYFSGTGTCYLGKEKKLDDYEFNYENNIEILRPILSSGFIDNILETSFNNDGNYYLIVSGNGVIDDILLSKESNLYNHTKNLSLLNLDINEDIYAECKTRLNIEESGAELDGVEFDKFGYINNSSYIYWGFSKLTELKTYSDFKKCYLSDIDLTEKNNDAVITTNVKTGIIETPIITLPNLAIIKSFMYKVNDVLFDDMKNIKITLLGSNSKNHTFKEICKTTSNEMVLNSNLYKFYKLRLEIPKGKKVSKIQFFVEYKSDDVNAPSKSEVSSGSFISKVIDSNYTKRYLINGIGIEDINSDITNYSFYIRASKENTHNSVWTSWKKISVNTDLKILNRVVFENYRYFQVKVIINGEDNKIKINNIDLEVI